MKNAKKLVGLLLFALLAWPAASRAATGSRSNEGHTFLTLDDAPVGGLYSVTQSGNEITMRVDPAELHSQPFAGWLWGSLTGSAPRLEKGSIIFADYNYREQRRLAFWNAILTEIDFPILNAADKDPVGVTLKLQVKGTRSLEMAGEVWLRTKEPSVPGNAFKLIISGVDTSHVSKVQLLPLVPRYRPSYRLGVTMYYVAYKSFQNWHNSEQKKNGKLVLEDASGNAVFSVELRGLAVSSTTWSTTSSTGSAALTFDSIATH